MISYRIRFSVLCPSCNNPDTWDVKGTGESHADWIREINAAGVTEWTCSKCNQRGVSKVLHADYELEVKKT